MKNYLFTCSVFLLVSVSVSAQKIIPVPKFKPPIVKTFLGIRSNGDTVLKEEAVQLVALPLKIEDAQKEKYKIYNYQFAYRKKSAVENEETGKIQTTYTMVAGRFDHSPLPEVWVKNLQTTLTSGEELYFFDIIVEDAKGRKFNAPEIKIYVK